LFHLVHLHTLSFLIIITFDGQPSTLVYQALLHFSTLLISNFGVFPSHHKFTIDISRNTLYFKYLQDFNVLILPFHVGANEKFPAHSKSFVAKAKLSNRPKTDYSPEF